MERTIGFVYRWKESPVSVVYITWHNMENSGTQQCVFFLDIGERTIIYRQEVVSGMYDFYHKEIMYVFLFYIHYCEVGVLHPFRKCSYWKIISCASSHHLVTGDFTLSAHHDMFNSSHADRM